MRIPGRTPERLGRGGHRSEQRLAGRGASAAGRSASPGRARSAARRANPGMRRQAIMGTYVLHEHVFPASRPETSGDRSRSTPTKSRRWNRVVVPRTSATPQSSRS